MVLNSHDALLPCRFALVKVAAAGPDSIQLPLAVSWRRKTDDALS